MLKQFQQLAKSKGLQLSALTVIGNVFAAGISAIALIVISRLLGPEKFGEFSVGFAIVLIIIRLVDFGLNVAVLKYAANAPINEQKSIFALTLKYKVFLSTTLALLGVTTASYLSDLLNFDNTAIILLAFTVGLSTVYYEHLLTMLQTLHRFSEAVFINIVQAVSKLLGAIIFYLLQLNVVPIFTWYVIAPLIPVIFYRYFLPKGFRFDFAQSENAPNKKIISLARHSAAGFIAAGLIENIDVLFLQGYLSSYETGLYGGVSRIALMFGLIAYSLGNVLNPRVAKYKTIEHLRRYLKKAWLVGFASLVSFFVFIPLASTLIYYTIGPDYVVGTYVMIILIASSFLAIASIPFIALFYTLDIDWYFSVSGILQLLIVLIGNWIFVPQFGLEAAAWTRLVARMLLLIFTIVVGLWGYRKLNEPKNSISSYTA